MRLRHDPGYVAAAITTGVRSIATGMGGTQVATVGRCDLHPNLVNVVAATATMTVDLRNTGVLPHNFSIDKLSISVDVAPGKSGEVTINAPAGTYQFYCNVPGHKDAGMVGVMTVK